MPSISASPRETGSPPLHSSFKSQVSALSSVLCVSARCRIVIQKQTEWLNKILLLIANTSIHSMCIDITILGIMMSFMRTTLTIDDDLFGILQRKSRERGESFKEIVNQTLRTGLNTAPTGQKSTVRTRPTALKLRPGLDPTRLNQLVDEMEVDHFLEKELKK